MNIKTFEMAFLLAVFALLVVIAYPLVKADVTKTKAETALTVAQAQETHARAQMLLIQTYLMFPVVNTPAKDEA